MTYISWSSGFALYLKDYLMVKVTLDIMDQYATKIDHIIYIYRSVNYISWSSDFPLFLENYLMDEGHTFG